MWSSLWVERPDARVRFDLSPEGGGSGTQLRWTLLFDQPLPGQTLLSHLRKRLNVLIFRGGAPPSGRDRPRQSCSADKASTSRLTDTTTAEAELRTLPMANPRLVRAPTSEPRLRSPPARPPSDVARDAHSAAASAGLAKSRPAVGPALRVVAEVGAGVRRSWRAAPAVPRRRD